VSNPERLPLPSHVEVIIVGGGAAGLMAGITAGRRAPHQSCLILDGAPKLGAKILVAGGGRCNVTHDQVTPEAYAGASPHAIKKVLRRFDVPETIAFFRELGVELKRESTGKLFPVSDSARTVLDALLEAVRGAGVGLYHPYRVEHISRQGDGFAVSGAWGQISAHKVVLATGGKSLPKSGSDGGGYALAQALGHQLSPRLLPALVPLTLPPDHFIRRLSGITLPTTLELRADSGKRLIAFTDSTLCTHFGLSGPSVLNISRHYLSACTESGEHPTLTINWLPDFASETLEAALQRGGRISVGRWLSDRLPERLAGALCTHSGVDPVIPCDQLPRESRKGLTRVVTGLPLPITGSRGFTYAEVTAGGIPLSDLHLDRMESRLCPGLYFCGEICDVDGQIGGYNFQWAWASGFVAGTSVSI